jgi:hypothetical protein
MRIFFSLPMHFTINSAAASKAACWQKADEIAWPQASLYADQVLNKGHSTSIATAVH